MDRKVMAFWKKAISWCWTLVCRQLGDASERQVFISLLATDFVFAIVQNLWC